MTNNDKESFYDYKDFSPGDKSYKTKKRTFNNLKILKIKED